MLVPIARYEGLLSLALAAYLMPSIKLQRFNPVVTTPAGSHVSMIRSGEVPTVSIGLCQEGTGSIELSVDDFANIYANLPGNIAHVTASTVEMKCKMIDAASNSKTTAPKSGLLAMALKLGAAPALLGVTLTPVLPPVRHYQFVDGGFDYTEKASMVEFMCPLITGATVPTSCKANDTRGVTARVTSIAHKSPLPALPAVYHDYVAEFVDCLIPAEFKHCLVPTSLDDVLAKLTRPTQRRIFEEGLCGMKDKATSVASFMKKEAGQTLSDPRIISTTPAYVKTFYSTITLALANFAKRHWPWYAFGKTPKAIAQQLADWCTSHVKQFVIQTDFSRFDGRVSSFVRVFEEMVLMRAFGPEFHAQINELHSKQYQQNARTRFGTTYQTLWTRLSGSPETSIFNTMLNALMEYVAQREHDPTRSPQEVFASLGLKGGDDGIAADLPQAPFFLVASKFGLKLTGECIPRGEPGVKFLARSFGPEVWCGDANSCCDFARTLSKFGLTVNMTGVTPAQKLVAKAAALRLTDPNTPYIQDFTAKVAEMAVGIEPALGPDLTELQRIQLTSWWSKYEAGEQFPNIARDWMVAEVNSVILSRQGQTTEFLAALRAATSLNDLLNLPPLCHLEAEPAPVDTMVNRVLMPAGVTTGGSGIKSAMVDGAPVITAFASAPNLPPAGSADDVRVCAAFARGNCTRVDCKYTHIPKKVHSVADLELMKTKPCHDFRAGKCLRPAGTCRFKH